MSDRAKSRDGDRSRDADRSRRLILGAAEELFAEHGFDGVSLGQIAAAAELSRGTPSYFFGSKEQLYRAVLEAAFEDREEAARDACRPLVAWAGSDDGPSIEKPLAMAVAGYLDFLLSRASFLKLIQREELVGGSRLQDVPRESKAIEEAFSVVRSVAPKRGLKSFAVQDAVLVFIALTFFPLAQRSTFMAALGKDLEEARVRRRHVRLVTDQLLHLVGLN